MPPGERDIVDRWVLSHLAEAVGEATAAFEGHDYMQAHQAASRMFWSIYCDRYIEMIKDRAGEASARWTLWESYRVLLGLFAPFAPFVTEHMYQRFYRDHEEAVSLHLTGWPAADPAWALATARPWRPWTSWRSSWTRPARCAAGCGWATRPGSAS